LLVFARFLLISNNIEKPSIQGRKVQSINFFLSLILILFFVFVVSGRSFHSDDQIYINLYSNLDLYDFNEIANYFSVEYGFILFSKIISLIGFSERGFLGSIVALQTILWFICLNKYLSSTKLLIALFFFISFFATYNLGANVLKQGIATPLAFIAGGFYLKRSYFISMILFFTASTFHLSSLIVLLSFLILYRFVSIKYYFLVFLLITTLSFLDVLSKYITLIPGVIDHYFHILNATHYKVGFRFEFWAFTSIPIMLYFFLNNDGKVKNDLLFKIYLTFSSIFIAAFSIPYSDRVGLYAWMFMIILIPNLLGNYKFSLFNDYRLFLILTTLLGGVMFLFYPFMQLFY
jgi:hypothetical protein